MLVDTFRETGDVGSEIQHLNLIVVQNNRQQSWQRREGLRLFDSLGSVLAIDWACLHLVKFVSQPFL